jgi:hypothetical protein
MVACRFLEQLDKADVDAILVPRGFANEGLSLVISIDSLRLYFRSAIENKRHTRSTGKFKRYRQHIDRRSH